MIKHILSLIFTIHGLSSAQRKFGAPVVNPTTTTTQAPQPPPLVILQRPSTTTTTALPTTSTTVAPPVGYIWGAYRQLCPASVLSPYLNNMCASTTDIAMDTFGVLYCEATAGCCMCASIQCGFGTTPCRELIFGDSAAKFVGDIQIKGQTGPEGALVSCNGVEACLGATITVIDCDAPRACQYARIRVTDPTENFVIECGGESSCEGMEIELNFSGAPPGYRCTYLGDPTYVKPVFQLEGIECGAPSACNSIDITINNQLGCRAVQLELVECIAQNSCNGAVFDLLGDVTLGRCLCGASCGTAVGLESCYTPGVSRI
eukprot:2433_1